MAWVRRLSIVVLVLFVALTLCPTTAYADIKVDGRVRDQQYLQITTALNQRARVLISEYLQRPSSALFLRIEAWRTDELSWQKKRANDPLPPGVTYVFEMPRDVPLIEQLSQENEVLHAWALAAKAARLHCLPAIKQFADAAYHLGSAPLVESGQRALSVCIDPHAPVVAQQREREKNKPAPKLTEPEIDGAEEQADPSPAIEGTWSGPINDRSAGNGHLYITFSLQDKSYPNLWGATFDRASQSNRGILDQLTWDKVNALTFRFLSNSTAGCNYDVSAHLLGAKLAASYIGIGKCSSNSGSFELTR